MDTKDIVGIILGVFGAIPSYVIAWTAYSKRRPRPPFGKWLREVRRSYPFLIGVLFSIAMIVLFASPSPGPEITITSPMDNASVPREITVEGYATRELPKGQHLYIVVEYGGRWWPQYSEIMLGYSASSKRRAFSTPADIGLPEDVGKSFTIRAILVDDAIHQHFQNWFQQAEWVGISITDVNQWGRVETHYGRVTVKRR
jgi:hypothetical protein